MKYYHIPITMAKIWSTHSTCASKNVEKQNLSLTGMGMQNGTGTSKDSSVISYNINILLPQDPVNMFLGIYIKKLKTYAHTRMFI